MEKHGLIYKHRGETSLEALKRFRQRENLDTLTPLTYAGTLDPMAEGLLLILIGDECKKKNTYVGLNKTYVVDVLFGAKTDTGDVLGLITEIKEPEVDTAALEGILEQFVGKNVKKYHPFSHKKVLGKPLFQHAKDGTLDGIEIPAKEISIQNIHLLGLTEATKGSLQKEIMNDIRKVIGDFRQKEIIARWETFFKKAPEKLPLAQIEVECSSGTYIRSLVEEIGHALQVPNLAYKIIRTKIGPHVKL